MTASFPTDLTMFAAEQPWNPEQQRMLIQGEVIVETESHNAWGGAVTAWMYLPLTRSQVWQKLTDYPSWVQYFPDITRSEVIQRGEVKRLYQAAQKAFLFFSAQVEIYLQVVEDLGQRIQFRLEKGSFHDFTANIELKDFAQGTILKYAVRATPTIPVPSIFIQQAMNFELPANMRKMRQVICKK
ncbi:Streptomyces cyclase/dehydrase [Calothrix sp. NIES-3974]|nr:SRPBCC family protein [Calothrix sp. NIES-3974]BAZ04054.1 Streptomyces cyclase/dehydrase [Calothrix sp. NIES-3974]